MMTFVPRLVILPFLVAAIGTAQDAAPAPANPQIVDVQGGKIRVVTVASGLYHPWSLAFADAHTLLVSERNGRLRMIRDGALLPDPLWTSPSASAAGGDALHFIAIHPSSRKTSWSTSPIRSAMATASRSRSRAGV